MNYKKMLSLLLAASMAVSMPINVFATQPVTETENQTEIEPYIADGEAPVLTGIEIDKTSVSAGDSVTLTITATDNLSGWNSCNVQFNNKEADKRLYKSVSDITGNKCSITFDISEYEPSRRYDLEFISLTDKAGNTIYYAEDQINDDRPLPKYVYFDVVANEQSDGEAPELKNISLNSTNIKSGEPLTITIEATDNLSGMSYCDVQFYSEDTDKKLVGSSYEIQNNICTITIDISEYEPTRRYNLEYVTLVDRAGNTVYYEEKPIEGNKPLPESIYFDVVANEQSDAEAPVLIGIEIDKTNVNAGDSVALTITATDNLSGWYHCNVQFNNKETDKRLYKSVSDITGNKCSITFDISEYEPNGRYDLEFVLLTDKAGNMIYYAENPLDNDKPLLESIYFTVINDDNILIPTPDPTPSNPDKGTSSNSSSSSSSAVSYESEKPNPADKKAVEAYNFWQNAKAKVRTTPNGKTMRLFVPKDITYMPASMMETLYREKITLIITHNGKKIVIPAGKAMPKQKLKVYWTFESLEKLYQA